MNSLLLNLTIACIWLFLSGQPSLSSFVVGFGIGFLMLAIFHPILHSATYVRRCLGFLRFVAVFLREFVVANLMVAKSVMFRSNESLHPNFISYDVTGLRPAEILLLSYCISLTPGTTTVEVSDDFKTLIFHALDADSPDALREHIETTLKPAILGFTR